MIVEDRW